MPNLSTMLVKDYSHCLGHLKSLIIIVSPRRAGAFSRDFTKNLASTRAFTRALKFKKLKAPLFPGPRGGGGGSVDTNDWCIT